MDITNTQNDVNEVAVSGDNPHGDGAPASLARAEGTKSDATDASVTEAQTSAADDAVVARPRATAKRQVRTASRTKKEIEARKAKKEAARAEREAKAAVRAARVPKAKREPFDINALAPDAIAVVERSIAAVHAIGRKTTENVLDLGQAFETMAAVIPDPLDWKEAVTRHCAVTVKTADNWRRVHRALGHRRETLVRHQVTPTVLIHLAAAPGETVDTVIASFEAGQPMKVSEVVALVRDSAPAGGEAGSAEAGSNGGPKGLRAQALAKAGRQMKGCIANLKAIRTALVEALEAAGPKRLKKGELVTALSPIAKRAHRDLTELLCDIDPASLVNGQSLTHLAAPDERWAGVLALLFRLAGDHWAEAGAMKSFISDEVLPTLAFVIDGSGSGTTGDEAPAGIGTADTVSAEADEVEDSAKGAVFAEGAVPTPQAGSQTDATIVALTPRRGGRTRSTVRAPEFPAGAIPQGTIVEMPVNRH